MQWCLPLSFAVLPDSQAALRSSILACNKRRVVGSWSLLMVSPVDTISVSAVLRPCILYASPWKELLPQSFFLVDAQQPVMKHKFRLLFCAKNLFSVFIMQPEWFCVSFLKPAYKSCLWFKEHIAQCTAWPSLWCPFSNVVVCIWRWKRFSLGLSQRPIHQRYPLCK